MTSPSPLRKSNSAQELAAAAAAAEQMDMVSQMMDTAADIVFSHAGYRRSSSDSRGSGGNGAVFCDMSRGLQNGGTCESRSPCTSVSPAKDYDVMFPDPDDSARRPVGRKLELELEAIDESEEEG
jgi:hypothetical protein